MHTHKMILLTLTDTVDKMYLKKEKLRRKLYCYYILLMYRS